MNSEALCCSSSWFAGVCSSTVTGLLILFLLGWALAPIIMCEISRRGWWPQYWQVILPHGDGSIFNPELDCFLFSGLWSIYDRILGKSHSRMGEVGLHDSYSHITKCHLRKVSNWMLFKLLFCSFRKVVFFQMFFFPPNFSDEPGMEGFPSGPSVDT